MPKDASMAAMLSLPPRDVPALLSNATMMGADVRLAKQLNRLSRCDAARTALMQSNR